MKAAMKLATVVIFAIILCLTIASASAASLTFPTSLQTIEDEAFYGDSSIDEIVLPEGIKTIGERAFAYSSINTIYLPSSINYIADFAFQNTNVVGTGLPGTYAHEWFVSHGLTYITPTTPIEDFEWETINGIEAKITKYIGSDATVYIPSLIDDYDIVEISSSAFRNNTSLETIYIPGMVRSIASHAFQNCSNLSEIIFCEGLTDIGAEAFRNCSKLSYANLPDSLEGLGEGAFRECLSLVGFHYPTNLNHRNSLYDNGYLYDGNIFMDCDSLVSYEIPEGTTYLCEGLFYGANKLESISLPVSLTDIGSNAFRNCVSLNSISLPQNLKTIHKNAFQSCILIESITIPNSVTTIESHAFEACTALHTIEFSNQLKEIGAGAFWNCSALTEANLPDSLEGLGESAFGECINLASIHYPLCLDHRNSEYDNGYLYDGKIFYNCKKLRRIIVPEGVSFIPNGIFMQANYLREVELPTTLTQIQNNAFRGCESIRSIIIPDGVTSIGSHAFQNCTALSSIEFPSSLQSLGAEVFANCTALTIANLPDSVEGLGESAFYGCTKLNSFHYPLHLNHLNSLYDNGYLYDGNVFHDCTALKTIEIPYGVTRIPNLMFAKSNYLQNVIIPDTVTEFGGGGALGGGGAFSDCVAIEKLYVSPHVTTIPGNTFSGCTNITIWCEYGSAILQYCKDNSVAYYYLTPDGVNSPSGSLYKGDHYGLHGYARASIPLTNVTATIWNEDKSSVIFSHSVAPGVTDYNLNNEINTYMTFSALPLGHYCYTLTASTELSEETWADRAFSIIPPPLRIYISNLSLPSGLNSGSADYTISGTIISNYQISRVEVTIIDANSDSTVKTAVAQPGSTTYDLSQLNGSLSLTSLGNGAYSVKIKAISNGETRVLVDTDFQSGVSEISSIDDDQRAFLLGFAADSSNREIFTTQYVDYVIDDMSWVESSIVHLDNFLSIGIFERIENALIYNGNRQDLIELYKKEIVQLIEDGAYDKFTLGSNIKKYSSDALSFIKSEGKLAKEAFHDFGNTNVEGYIKSINGLIGSVKDGISTAADLESAYETIATIVGNFEGGLYVLDYIGSSAHVASESEFNEALNILKIEYVSSKAAIVYEHTKIIQDLILEFGEDKVKDALTDLLKEGFGIDFSVGLPKLFAKLTMKATGLDDVASTYKKLFVRVDLLNISNNSYCSAFDAVHNGDTSDAALLRLANAISITKSAWVRANDTITVLPRYIGTSNEYLDYRYNGKFSILLDESDYD